MQLNSKQQSAFHTLTSYIVADNSNPYLKAFGVGDSEEQYEYQLLKGYAGTGKTVTINKVVEYCIDMLGHKLRIGMTATTNKAVRILKMYSEFQNALDFATIHSFCGLKQVINDRSGVVTYEPDYESKNKPKIEEIDVLIIDEASMLNKSLFEILHQYKERLGFKVIFVGDPNQLPPVGEEMAIPFDPVAQKKYNIGVVELDEIMRQAKDNPIIDYATSIRTSEQYNGNGIEKLPVAMDPVVEVLRKYFVTPDFEKNPDFAKVLAYRNITVDRFNAIVRELVFKGTNLPKILLNDCLIADKPVMSFSIEKGKWIVSIATNEEMRVVNVLNDSMNYSIDYRIYAAVPRTFYSKTEASDFKSKLSPADKRLLDNWNEQGGITLNIPDWDERKVTFKTYQVSVEYLIDGVTKRMTLNILHEDSEKLFQQTQDSLKQAALAQKDLKIRKALWVQFYELQNHFAWTKYNYAITVHKS